MQATVGKHTNEGDSSEAAPGSYQGAGLLH